MTDRKPNQTSAGVGRLIRLAGLSAFVVALDPAFAVPTTELLAIGSFTAEVTPGAWKALVPAEMRQTARLYLDGKIDQ